MKSQLLVFFSHEKFYGNWILFIDLEKKKFTSLHLLEVETFCLLIKKNKKLQVYIYHELKQKFIASIFYNLV